MPLGVELLEAEEGVPILETTLIARELRPMFLSHEGCPISTEQGIHETGFLCPPACAFFRGNRWELLLEPAPCDACADVGGFTYHGFLLRKGDRCCLSRKGYRDGRKTQPGESLVLYR